MGVHISAGRVRKWMGNDAIVGNPNYASLPLRGTGKREGGKKTQPLEHSNPIHLVYGHRLPSIKRGDYKVLLQF